MGAADGMRQATLGATMMDKKNKVVGNRRLIGRCTARVSKLSKLGSKDELRPQWLEIYGGTTNQLWTGDILFAAEIMRKKDSARIPVENVAPPRKQCVVQTAFHSIRDLAPIYHEHALTEIQKPTIVLGTPFFSEVQAESKGNLKRIDWSKEVDARHALGDGDSNLTWLAGEDNPLASFDFLCCHSVEAELLCGPEEHVL